MSLCEIRRPLRSEELPAGLPHQNRPDSQSTGCTSSLSSCALHHRTKPGSAMPLRSRSAQMFRTALSKLYTGGCLLCMRNGLSAPLGGCWVTIPLGWTMDCSSDHPAWRCRADIAASGIPVAPHVPPLMRTPLPVVGVMEDQSMFRS